MPQTNVNPYDINEIVSTLSNTKQDIGAALEKQNTRMEAIQAQISADRQKSQEAINEFRRQVTSALATTPDAPASVSLERQNIDINSIVAPMRKAVEEQVTNMRNSYNSQVQVQAKQLDAAVGAGAFGGNSYRAQQAYQSSMNQLFNKTNADVANLVLNAETQIMSSVSELSGLQAQLNQAAEGQEAQLNVEQSMRYRELIANREVQLMGMMGNIAQMTAEAGSVMTGNWLNLMSINNQSMNQLMSLSAQVDFKEVDVRQQLARDVFGAEMQMITNNMQLQQAYINANAQMYSAQMAARTAKRQSRTQAYVAELNAETNIRLATISGQQQLQVAQVENQAASQMLQQLGIGGDTNEITKLSPQQNIQNLIDNNGFTRLP